MAMIKKVTPPIERILPEIKAKENGEEYRIAITEPVMTKTEFKEGIAIPINVAYIDKFGEAAFIGKKYSFLEKE